MAVGTIIASSYQQAKITYKYSGDYMIIVYGSVTVRGDAREQAQELCFYHVRRSRSEPGCISHEVLQDTQDPNRFLFFERWESMAMLEQHFQVPESGLFINSIAEIATVAPSIKLYEADEIKRH